MRPVMLRARTLAIALAVFLTFPALLASLAGCEALEEASDSVTESINDLGESSNSSNSSNSSECRGPSRRAAQIPGACCFDSFRRAKKFLHANVVTKQTGYDWHHIVGQHQANKDKFGEGDLHCTDNLVYLPRERHQRVSSHYNRIHESTNPKRFYQWLADKSFKEQYRIGIEVLEEHGWERP